MARTQPVLGTSHHTVARCVHSACDLILTVRSKTLYPRACRKLRPMQARRTDRALGDRDHRGRRLRELEQHIRFGYGRTTSPLGTTAQLWANAGARLTQISQSRVCAAAQVRCRLSIACCPVPCYRGGLLLLLLHFPPVPVPVPLLSQASFGSTNLA